jgi:hypothetical protein
MATGPSDASSADYPREAAAPRERSVGEHIFIWIAWALAAAFWGAIMSSVIGIFRAASQPMPAIGAPGLPGGMFYLALVVVAFVLVGLTLAYAELRTARAGRRMDAVTEAGTAALYNRIERQGGEDMTARSPDRDRPEHDFR